MKLGAVTETFPMERRVALTPNVLPRLTDAGLSVVVERGAGSRAGFDDAAYVERGARLAASRSQVFETADVVVQVRTLGANPEAGRADIERIRPGQILIGFAGVFAAGKLLEELAGTGARVYALELVPRVSRAQSMDALSSMATVAGYKAVLVAAERLSRMFPMLVTAAGTITPARVFVLGAGVAGLSAIATARRLGARVTAYDVRPEAREEIASLGATALELGLPLDVGEAQDERGYAKGLGEAFYRRQRDMLRDAVSASDVVISSAAVPGKRAPVLVTRGMIEAMPRGSVVVDLAAEGGGNCELTEPDRVIVHRDVTIFGPTNLPSTVPFHASQMYARNVSEFVLHLVETQGLGQSPDDDEILRETLVAAEGRVNPRVVAPPSAGH